MFYPFLPEHQLLGRSRQRGRCGFCDDGILMPLIGGNEKEKDTVVAEERVAAAVAAAAVAVVVSEWCLSYAPRGKSRGWVGREEGRIDTWGDRIRRCGRDFRLRLREICGSLAQSRTLGPPHPGENGGEGGDGDNQCRQTAPKE